ncbi:dipeptidase PepE, partial [Escherichia coli]
KYMIWCGEQLWSAFVLATVVALVICLITFFVVSWILGITDVVKRGALYIGWSAGANLACPTIRTTNDMPIVDPQGFDALNLFPLQINPHFTNALPEGHKGETREQRIRELLVVAPELTIIGLPEGNWITVSKGHATLGGPNTTYVFKAGEEAVPLEAGHRF